MCIGIYTSTSIALDKKDGGNVTTQEVGYMSCLSLLSCRVLSAGPTNNREKEGEIKRERGRETKKSVMLLTIKVRLPLSFGIAIQR